MIEPEYDNDAPDYDIQIEPFTKTNWKTATSRDIWKQVLRRAASAKHYAEWASVLSDKTERKAAVIHINNENRERWLERISDADLVYREIRYSEPYDGFAHKFYPTDGSDPTRITYSVVARNNDIADKFKEAELDMSSHERHNTVGKFLGFPECCRDFFNNAWIDEGKTDPIYEITCNTDSAEAPTDGNEDVIVKDPSPFANIMWRYFGWSFITHMPCSWDCQKSIDVGKRRQEIMENGGFKEAANELEKWLSEPFVWTGYHRLAHIRNRHIIGETTTSNYWSKKRVVWNKEHDAGGGIFEPTE